MEDGRRGRKSVQVGLVSLAGMTDVLATYTHRQDSTCPETGISGFQTQDDDVGGTEGQGRTKAETYSGWGEQTEGRKEEGCPCGAVLTEWNYKCCFEYATNINKRKPSKLLVLHIMSDSEGDIDDELLELAGATEKKRKKRPTSSKSPSKKRRKAE